MVQTIYNTIKDPHRYAVHGSDTTMILIAASLPGQQNLQTLIILAQYNCPITCQKCVKSSQKKEKIYKPFNQSSSIFNVV